MARKPKGTTTTVMTSPIIVPFKSGEELLVIAGISMAIVSDDVEIVVTQTGAWIINVVTRMEAFKVAGALANSLVMVVGKDDDGPLVVVNIFLKRLIECERHDDSRCSGIANRPCCC